MLTSEEKQRQSAFVSSKLLGKYKFLTSLKELTFFFSRFKRISVRTNNCIILKVNKMNFPDCLFN